MTDGEGSHSNEGTDAWMPSGQKRFILTSMLLASTLLLFFVVVILGFPTAWFNDQRLERFSAHVYQHPLPPETTVLSREARFGLLFANGNHCDYWATMTMETGSSKAAVLAHYEGLTFPPAWRNSPSAVNGRIKVAVDFLPPSQSGALRYRIDVMDGGYPAGVDLRCH